MTKTNIPFEYDVYPKGSYPPAVVALEHGSGRILFSGGAVSYGEDVYDNRTFIWNILRWLVSGELREELSLTLSVTLEFGDFSVGNINIQEELVRYENLAQMALQGGDFQLSEEYYSKLYNLHDKLGNESERDIISDKIAAIKSISAQSYLL